MRDSQNYSAICNCDKLPNEHEFSECVLLAPAGQGATSETCGIVCPDDLSLVCDLDGGHQQEYHRCGMTDFLTCKPLPAPSAPDMEAVVSQTFSVPFTCPNCSDCDERVANLNAFIRELQKREDAPLAFYRGRREALDLLAEFFVGNVRLVICNELQKNLGCYEEPR